MEPLEQEQNDIFKKLGGKPLDKNIVEAHKKYMRESIKDMNKPKPRPKCRWCQGETRPLNSNGICGPGYAEWNFVCKECGRVQ